MDALETMLGAQLRLQQESFGLDPTLLEGEARIEFIRWNVLALEDELHEVLGEIGWKPWATSKHVNVTAAMKELVDAWHFFMNLMLVIAKQSDVEFLAYDFTTMYMEKRGVNAARQADGYDGVSGKCPDCHRDLATVALTAVEDTDGTVRQACPCGKVLT